MAHLSIKIAFGECYARDTVRGWHIVMHDMCYELTVD